MAGRPLHEVHADILIEPRDLRSTFFLGRTEPRDATPPPTPLRADGEPLDMPLILRSINSIYSTASDSIAFLRGLMQGRVFRNPETLQMMQANSNRLGFPCDRAALRAPNWPIEYGLGIKRPATASVDAATVGACRRRPHRVDGRLALPLRGARPLPLRQRG